MLLSLNARQPNGAPSRTPTLSAYAKECAHAVMPYIYRFHWSHDMPICAYWTRSSAGNSRGVLPYCFSYQAMP